VNLLAVTSMWFVFGCSSLDYSSSLRASRSGPYERQLKVVGPQPVLSLSRVFQGLDQEVVQAP